MLTNKNAKNALIFECEKCEFKCYKKSNYEKHLSTRKHQNIDKCLQQNIQKDPNIFICHCGKEYKYRQSLSVHKKKCNEEKHNENNILNHVLTKDSSEVVHLTNLVIKLMNTNEELYKKQDEFQQQQQKQNQDFQNKILDVCKTSSINNSYNNSNNKTFNMQVFLNEKCKDAMNLMDFVHSMMLDFSDLEELGELGYVEGISRQMVRKLNEMDVYKRPIHCSDLKRETMYVRDNDVWEKETELYEKLRKAIKYITKKNGDLMIPWRNAHPQCMNLQHPLNDKYLGIMNQAMGGKGEFFESESKIIRKISKSVTIDKKDM